MTQTQQQPGTQEILDDLDRLIKEVDAAKNDLAKSEGKLELERKSLEDKFGAKTVAEAKSFLDEATKALNTKEEALKTTYTKLKGTYDW